MEYEDYAPTTKVSATKDGYRVTRELFLRGASEGEIIFHPDCPQIGDQLDIGDGSISNIVICEDVQISQVERAAGKDGKFLFQVSAKYATPSANNPQANKATWRVSFRQEVINIKNVRQASDQTRYGPGGSGAPQYPIIKTAINVTGDGVQGVDIVESVEVLSITYYKRPEDVASFVDDLRALVDKVNDENFSGPWGTYLAGEARISGLEVSATAGGRLVSVSVEIERRPNASIFVYLDSTGGDYLVEKKGQQYLWVRYLRAKPGNEDNVRLMSVDAYVATVYEYGDFSALGISPNIWM